MLLVVERGLLEHWAETGGLGAGPLLRLRRGEAAFSLLQLVEGRLSLESARSMEANRRPVLLLLLVASSEMCPSMLWTHSPLRKGELLLLLLRLLT